MIIQLKVDHTFVAILGTYVVFEDGRDRRALRRERWDKTPYTRGQLVDLELDDDDCIKWPTTALSVVSLPV